MGASKGRPWRTDLAAAAGGAIYLYILSRELALTCFSVTVLLWAVALRYGAFTRKAQRAYQDGLAETNEVQPARFLLWRQVDPSSRKRSYTVKVDWH